MRSVRVLYLAGLLSVISPDSAALAQAIECGSPYTVSPGDTLSSIASRAYGVGSTSNVDRLYFANRDIIGGNPNRIVVGRALRVPCPDDVPGTGEAAAGTDPAADPATALTPDPAGTGTITATFDAAPALEPTPAVPTGGARVEIVFNRSAPQRFVLNSGILEPFFADIARATRGRVAFVDPQIPNRDPFSQLDHVRAGRADGAYMFVGHLADSHPLVQITMQPMISGSALETAVALWRTWQTHFRPAGSFGDVHLLGFVAAPPAHLWRMAGGEALELKLDGETAWAMPYLDANVSGKAELIASLGSDRPIYALAHGAARAAGVWKPGTSVTEIEGGVYAPAFAVFISKEAWDRISPEDQAAIDRLAGERLALRSAAWDSFDNGHRADMLRQGLIVEAADADFDLMVGLQDRARMSWEAWIARADAAGADGYTAFTFYIDEITKLREQYRSPQ